GDAGRPRKAAGGARDAAGRPGRSRGGVGGTRSAASLRFRIGPRPLPRSDCRSRGPGGADRWKAPLGAGSRALSPHRVPGCRGVGHRRLPPGTGLMSRAGLTPEAVTAAAAAVVDEEGLEALSMARLARNLGV